MRKLVGLGVLAVLTVACVDELAEGAGEMLVDAGQVLADAGLVLADAGNDSAQALTDAGALNTPAAESYDVLCDQKAERVTRTADLTTTYAMRFAVVNVDTKDIVGVDVRRCGHELIGTVAAESCAANETCSGTARLPLTDCDLGSFAELLPMQVRVHCGTELHQSPSQGTDYGNIFKTARITIRRR